MVRPPKHNPVKHRYTKYGSDRLEIQKWVFNYKEVFDMTMLYTLAHEWLIDEGWAPRDDFEFPEIHYLQRELPFGKEIWIRWRCHKDADFSPKGADGSALFHYEMDIEFHVLGLKNTEIIVKDQKFKTNKGEVEIACNCGLILDYKGYFDKNPILKPIRKMWIERVIWPKTRLNKIEVQSQAFRFRDAISTYLQVEKLLSDTEFAEFWTKKSME